MDLAKKETRKAPRRGGTMTGKHGEATAAEVWYFHLIERSLLLFHSYVGVHNVYLLSQALALEEALFGSTREAMPETDMPGDEEDVGHGAGNGSAWHDSDDEELNVDIASGSRRLRKLRKTEEEGEISGKEFEKRLREQYKSMNTSSGWVKKLEERAATKVQGVGGLLAKGPAGRIPPGLLEITKLADANRTKPSQSVINSVEFHPAGQLFMAAGLDRRVSFFSVDGVKNPHVQTIFFEDMPIHQAQFINDGSKIFCTGRRKFFYSLDLETSKMEKICKIFGREEKSFESFVSTASSDTVAFIGQDGSIPLVSVSSRQLIDTLKMNGTVRAGAFSNDGMHLYTSGGDGIVHIWDMRKRQCVRKFVDEGNLGSSSIAVSSSGLLASGSKSGIVNMYKDVNTMSHGSSLGAETLSPYKTLPHLTTMVDSMRFSSDGQVLAMASRLKRDALRLIHVDTMTAFSNWPTSKSPLHYVHSVAFSPKNGYVAIGNARGRVVMYRLHHYPV